MKKTSSKPGHRSRRRVLFGVALIVAILLLAYSYRYDLILMLPSVQADTLHLISYDTKLPLPPSSRIVKFSELLQEGPFRDWRLYWISWGKFGEFWRFNWSRRYQDDPDSWCAKIVMSESSYAEFKKALSTRPDSPFQDGPFIAGVVKWEPVNPEFKRIIVGENQVDCVQVSTWKEGGNYAIFIGYECK